MVRVVGRAPSEYRCTSCPAHVRASRRCPKTPQLLDPQEELHLQEARRRGDAPPPDPTHPEACPVLHVERSPRALEVLDWAASWEEHGEGPGGRGLWWQPESFLAGVYHLAAERAQIAQEERERAEADRRFVEAGGRL